MKKPRFKINKAGYQLERHEVKNTRKNFPLSIVCDNVEDPRNVGAIFRICEAMGVMQLYLCGKTPAPPSKLIKKTARSADGYLPHISGIETAEAIRELHKKDYRIYALEISSNAIDLQHFLNQESHDKIALIVGGEKEGVSREVLEIVDNAVKIPMFGINTSINVVQALSIALWEIVRGRIVKLGDAKISL